MAAGWMRWRRRAGSARHGPMILGESHHLRTTLQPNDRLG